MNHHPAFGPPCLGDKLIDLALLARAGGVNGKVVLEQGPRFPIDAILLGPYAREWTSIDIDHDTVARCKALQLDPKISFHERSIALLAPEWTEKFDMVINFSTLDDTMPDIHASAFREIRRVLKMDGVFINTYANFDFMPKDIYGTSNPQIRQSPTGVGIEYWYRPGELEQVLRDVAQLSVEYHEHNHARSGIIARKL